MTTKFGLEIEYIGPHVSDMGHLMTRAGFECHSESYNHSTRSYWKVVQDGSVCGGGEIVSPPLPYNPESLGQIDAVYSALSNVGASMDQTCGLHVHVDATWLRAYTSNQRDAFFTFLTAAFQKHEAQFDMMVQNHRNQNGYCKSTLGKTARDLRSDRYHKLNLCSYTAHGTVEFRQYQGTMNAKAVKAWVTLCVAFVANCRKHFEAANRIAATPATV